MKKDTVSDVVDFDRQKEGKFLLLTTPQNKQKRSTKEQLDILIQQGYARIYTADGMQRLDDLNGSIPKEFELIVDRVLCDMERRIQKPFIWCSRCCLFEGDGQCEVLNPATEEHLLFKQIWSRWNDIPWT